jgi:hypothetical protein
MGRSDPPTNQSASSFRDYAKALRHNADLFEKLADAMEKEGINDLLVLHFKSGQEAFQKMRSYQKAIEDAFGGHLLTRATNEVRKVQMAAEKKTEYAVEALKKAKKPKDS